MHMVVASLFLVFPRAPGMKLQTLCKYSYANNVKPNWGLLLITLAGPPLNRARNPSSRPTNETDQKKSIQQSGPRAYKFSQMHPQALYSSFDLCVPQPAVGFSQHLSLFGWQGFETYGN
jgi:hypothetical protein